MELILPLKRIENRKKKGHKEKDWTKMTRSVGMFSILDHAYWMRTNGTWKHTPIPAIQSIIACVHAERRAIALQPVTGTIKIIHVVYVIVVHTSSKIMATYLRNIATTDTINILLPIKKQPHATQQILNRRNLHSNKLIDFFSCAMHK